jgi:NTE family protein
VVDNATLSDNPTYKIGQLSFVNMTPSDASFIRTKFKLKEGNTIDTERIHLITTSICMDLFYQSADFHVDNDAVEMPDGTKATRIKFFAGEKKTNKMNVGVRFDTEEIVAMQANIAFPIRKKVPMELDFTLRLGKRI